MNKILKYLVNLSILSIIVGPFGVLPLGIPQINIYFTDIAIGLIGLIWIFNIGQILKVIKSDDIAKYFCIFVGITVISLIFSPLNLNIREKLVSGLYIVRLAAYFFVYLTIRFLTGSSTIGGVRVSKAQLATPEVFLTLMTSAGLILALFGWLQYFLYPDLRNLYYLGWDPHFKRIFSTYLDPNFFGLMMVLTLISLFYYSSFTWKESLRNTFQVAVWTPGRWIVAIFVFITLMFTYSRSSFISLTAAIVYIFLVAKKYKFIAGFLLAIFVSMLLLPRPGGVGVQLERVFSIETRFESWQQAVRLILDHPILGVGFNTVRFAKSRYNFGQDNLTESHSGAGFDNSFLFVGATTGFFGLLSLFLLAKKVFKNGNLWMRSSLMAVIIHSFFLNSLFFPWIMLWMWVIVAMGASHSGERSDYRNDSGQARMTET